MRQPYSLSSDQHCHDWSQFASITADGVNTRLQAILDEMVHQAEETRKRGWSVMRFGGDLFHVRGKLAPSVLNPTIATVKKILAMGITRIDCLAGNHDLEGIHSTALGNAMQSLDELDGFNAITTPTLTDDGVYMVPWIQDLDELRKVIADPRYAIPGHDLIIHAPVNGVIKGIPDHGLEADELKALGYRRAFAGHYHNFVPFGDGVFSIGATTHQTWSDPGTSAGFLTIEADGNTQFHPTRAPRFVDIDSERDLGTHIKGSYCRMRLVDRDEADIKKVRGILEANGALGIVDTSSKKRPNTRGVANVASGLTIEASITSYCRDHLTTTLDRDKIATEALDVLRATVAA